MDLDVIFEGETKFLNPPVNHDATSAPDATDIEPKKNSPDPAEICSKIFPNTIQVNTVEKIEDAP